MSVQRGWRCCWNCDSVYYAPLGNACPKGGSHHAMSTGYLPFGSPEPGTQDKWRWCKRCGAMFYSGLGAGRCTNGAGHDASGSGAYFLKLSHPGGLGQTGFRWCRNCQSLWRNRGSGGACHAANGGPHSSDGSGDYGLNVHLAGEGVVVVYQGRGDDGTIWMSVRQDSQWICHVRVPGGCSVTPSVAMFRGKLWILYQGMGDCRDLWYTTFDGANFSNTTRAGDIRLKGAPCAAVVDDRLEVWLQGTSNAVDLWRCWLDNVERGLWKSELIPTDTGIWNDPGVVPLPDSDGGGAWVLFERATNGPGGKSSSGFVMRYHTRSRTCTEVSNASSGSPAGVYWRQSVFTFHEGPGGNGKLCGAKLSPSDGGKVATVTDHDGTVATHIHMSAVPAPVVDNDRLYVFHEGPGDNGELRMVSSFDGKNWDGESVVPGVGVSTGCSATRFRFDP